MVSRKPKHSLHRIHSEQIVRKTALFGVPIAVKSGLRFVQEIKIIFKYGDCLKVLITVIYKYKSYTRVSYTQSISSGYYPVLPHSGHGTGKTITWNQDITRS